MAEMPVGWLSGYEIRLLYALASIAKGPILELGSWLGRSTCAIAAGVRDGGGGPFDTVDYGITSPTEWKKLFGSPIIPYETNPAVLRAVLQPGGSTSVLIENLRRLNLVDHVTSVIRGDSRRVPLRSSYAFIFCDTLHDPTEVRSYAPLLKGLLQRGAILACDDVLPSGPLGEMIRELVGCGPMFYSNSEDRYSKIAVCLKE
jgi:predicted O-methyltransferase YrrM